MKPRSFVPIAHDRKADRSEDNMFDELQRDIDRSLLSFGMRDPVPRMSMTQTDLEREIGAEKKQIGSDDRV